VYKLSQITQIECSFAPKYSFQTFFTVTWW